MHLVQGHGHTCCCVGVHWGWLVLVPRQLGVSAPVCCFSLQDPALYVAGPAALETPAARLLCRHGQNFCCDALLLCHVCVLIHIPTQALGLRASAAGLLLGLIKSLVPGAPWSSMML